MNKLETRVWDKKRKRMYRGNEINSIHWSGILQVVIEEEKNDWMVMPEEYDLMVYTGKKDIKGVKIWEGDILRYSIDGHVQSPLYIVKDMVEWFEEMYADDSYCRWDGTGEVVGNAYENPELTEGG